MDPHPCPHECTASANTCIMVRRIVAVIEDLDRHICAVEHGLGVHSSAAIAMCAVIKDFGTDSSENG